MRRFITWRRDQDLSCTVIQALGDKFDFLAYYSDFRIDSQEASSPSDGPIGGNVTGIGDTKHAQTKPILESRCTGGRFQLGLFQPIFVGANEMQESPPDNAPAENPKNIAFYTRPLAQATPDGKPVRTIRRRASRSRDRTPLVGVCCRPREWPDDLARRVAPLGSRVAGAWRIHSLPLEASTEGGGVWQDNLDGTFTQLRDGYLPASGYSYLDLYLMGLIAAGGCPTSSS